MNNKKSFLNYINVFRALAIFLIIAGHTMQIGDSSSLIHKINCEIICGGTALFIFISGFLFQHLSSKFEYRNYLSKKWTNVIMPYLITSLPGILFCLFYPKLYGNSFDGLNIFIQIPMFLSTGRIHNTPSWFILMIILFFLCSYILLKLEKMRWLYKLLPFAFLITLIYPRVDVDYNSIINLSYTEKYFACIGYIINGFIHFFSLYIFGMFCSSHKEIIDKFYKNRFIIWILMLFSAGIDIYLSYKNIYSNFSISKIFLTILLLGYLKHYDNLILSRKKLNNMLDIFAKYSFGLFFVHWYWFFIYNQIFNLEKVILINNNFILVIGIVVVRFIVVTTLSLISLYVCKKIILSVNKNLNTRMFLGV